MTRSRRSGVDDLYADSATLMDTFNEGTDLACVLISASYLDSALGSLLERYLASGKTTSRLLDAEGVLGSLQQRADMAYALGLIAKAHYQNSCRIAQVRNMIAHHHLELGFSDSEVILLVEDMVLPSLSGGDPDAMVLRMASAPRARYTIVAAGLVLLVLQLASCVERVQSSQTPW